MTKRMKLGMNLAMVLAFATFVVFSMNSCYYDNEEELYGVVFCDTSFVSFDEDIEPILENNCAISGCHIPGGGGNGLFLNYDGVKDKVDNGSMYERVVVQKDMPTPDREPLTECQINFIAAWINAGAPNN